MVVIKEAKNNLSASYGSDFLAKIKEFSTVIGYSVEEEAGDLKIEFNPDRPDLFSFASLQSAILTYHGAKVWQPLKFSKDPFEFIIEKSARDLRPLAIGFQCKGKSIGPHFRDLIDYQERIHLSIGKDRSKVSIGIHDTSNIMPPIFYRAYKRNEIRFTTYDNTVSGSAEDILLEHPKGIQYGHLVPGKEKVPVIVDKEGKVLSMPPVINGNATAVDEKSKNFFIDITGTDPKALRDAFFLLAYFFQNLGYSLSISNMEDLESQLAFDGREITVPYSSISQLIGLEIPTDKLSPLLSKMGYSSTALDDSVAVQVPGNRIDVMGPADVIEDIAKAFGYQNIKYHRPALNIIGSEAPIKPFLSLTRNVLTGLGYQEIMSYVVTTRRFYDSIEYRGGVQVRNPKSMDFSVVRDRLYLGVLDFLRINRRRNLPQQVFEIGEILLGSVQKSRICVAKANSRTNYSEIKQILDAFLLRMGVKNSIVESVKIESFIDGRSGKVSFDGKNFGIIGEVHPDTLQAFELKIPVSIFELDLGVLHDHLKKNS